METKNRINVSRRKKYFKNSRRKSVVKRREFWKESLFLGALGLTTFEWVEVQSVHAADFDDMSLFPPIPQPSQLRQSATLPDLRPKSVRIIDEIENRDLYDKNGKLFFQGIEASVAKSLSIFNRNSKSHSANRANKPGNIFVFRTMDGFVIMQTGVSRNCANNVASRLGNVRQNVGSTLDFAVHIGRQQTGFTLKQPLRKWDILSPDASLNDIMIMNIINGLIAYLPLAQRYARGTAFWLSGSMIGCPLAYAPGVMENCRNTIDLLTKFKEILTNTRHSNRAQILDYILNFFVALDETMVASPLADDLSLFSDQLCLDFVNNAHSYLEHALHTETVFAVLSQNIAPLNSFVISLKDPCFSCVQQNWIQSSLFRVISVSTDSSAKKRATAGFKSTTVELFSMQNNHPAHDLTVYIVTPRNTEDGPLNMDTQSLQKQLFDIGCNTFVDHIYTRLLEISKAIDLLHNDILARKQVLTDCWHKNPLSITFMSQLLSLSDLADRLHADCGPFSKEMDEMKTLLRENSEENDATP
jgi:hypothetical protein